MTSTRLSCKHCAPCHGQIELLPVHRVNELVNELHADWRVSDDSTSLQRKFVFKGFAKATYLVNLCIWLADREGHHPDVTFGWGYCQIALSTHDVHGLTENDFIWAARLDTLIQ
ncbi:MAG: 4a-hydroxytetrahydrobiopterin dehydratase [Granulosicoccus sp.]